MDEFYLKIGINPYQNINDKIPIQINHGQNIILIITIAFLPTCNTRGVCLGLSLVSRLLPVLDNCLMLSAHNVILGRVSVWKYFKFPSLERFAHVC